MPPLTSGAARDAASWASALGMALLMQTTSACPTRVFPILGPALSDQEKRDLIEYLKSI